VEAKVKRPKQYVQPRIGMFSAMSPLEAWTDQSGQMRYVELVCRNQGNEFSWSAFQSAAEVRRLGEWMIAAAAWMEDTRTSGASPEPPAHVHDRGFQRGPGDSIDQEEDE
jgi:hypothetical protein